MAGDRVGLIRFGSRVDVFLPHGTSPRIIKGQRCVAGETILAEIGVDQDLTCLQPLGRRIMLNPPRNFAARTGTQCRNRDGALHGLSGVWFAMQGRWDAAVAAVVVAGVLDALDGRIARMLKGESRFGAELDSLSDVIAFGATPALIIYSWVLTEMPRFGWTISVFFVLCAALRLARFNARIDADDQPHKSAGFNTGIPSPAGAGLASLPLIIWIEFGVEAARDWRLVAPWLLLWRCDDFQHRDVQLDVDSKSALRCVLSHWRHRAG